jgi:hypothetical protein
VSPLDSKIDDLYRGLLDAFVGARTALAKTLTAADAQRVRKLPKPTVVPWAVNQVYWHARGVFDRLTKSGERVREAQIAALEGRKADVRAATDAHRRALADAVREAERLAGASGVHPDKDGLMRTFEGLSLATTPQETPGRLTRPLQPSGFEALAGITVKAQPTEVRAVEGVRPKVDTGLQAGSTADARHAKKEAAARKKEAAARKKRDAAVRKAEAAFERARRRMDEAAEALRRSRGQIS